MAQWSNVVCTVDDEKRPTLIRDGSRVWLKYYFWQGQDLKGGTNNVTNANRSFLDRHRRAVAMLGPCTLFQIVWWAYMLVSDDFGVFQEVFKDTPRWYMTITMVGRCQLVCSPIRRF